MPAGSSEPARHAFLVEDWAEPQSSQEAQKASESALALRGRRITVA
jgi:hypothetical protein